MIGYFEGLDAKTRNVLYEIYKRGPVTKKEILSIMNLKLTTLNRMMNALEERKLVVPLGEAESTGGRKAAVYDVAHHSFYLIGIDLSRTYVKVVLTNLKLSIIKTKQFPLDERFSSSKTMDEVISVIKKMIEAEKVQKEQVLGIGIGTVGPLDREKGIMLNPEGFLNRDWENVPLKATIESRLSIPCFIDNGANNAALAEYRFGIGKDNRSVAYIHCGIGIRSAVIKDGIVIRTMNDREDAFGHMTIQMRENGESGNIESFSALGGLIRKMNAELKLSADELNETNYRAVLGATLQKNEAVAKIIQNGAVIFGKGLSNFARLLNPDIVILSGPLMMNLEGYYQACIDAFYEHYHSAGKIQFNKGGLFQEDTIAIGSAALVMENYLSKKAASYFCFQAETKATNYNL